jgi:hypothetical protein
MSFGLWDKSFVKELALRKPSRNQSLLQNLRILANAPTTRLVGSFARTRKVWGLQDAHQVDEIVASRP